MLCVLLCDCICEGESCHTCLGVPVPADAGIAGITCPLSLHMFPPFVPELDEPSAAAECLPHPEKYQHHVRMLVSCVHLGFMHTNT